MTTTKEAILIYLRVVDEPATLFKLSQYMERMHQKGRAAVRTELWRLCQEGLVERVGPGMYRAKTGLDVKGNLPG